MFRNSFNRLFPMPSYLSMPSFGLDISDESVKFVALQNTKKGIKVSKSGERKIPAGIIESGKIIDPGKLEEILISIRKEEGVKSVRVSMPEEQIYLFELKLSKSGLTSIREAIELSIEEHIPIPAQDAIFDYELVREDEHELHLEVQAIPNNVIDNYLSVFRNAEIAIESLELEAQAVARAVIKKDDSNTYMIIDFGQKRTGIFVVSAGVVVFTSTLDVGGATLSNMIMKNFRVSYEEAEQMKITYGLQRNIDNKEIFSILLNSASILRDELVKHYIYWQTHKDEQGKNNTPIKKVFLCGGDSNLIGLSDYLSVSIKTKVEMADVWVNIVDTEKHIPEMSFKRSLSFAAAVGLALGDFEYE